MIICPWCGTNYLSFQSNCSNCGGPIPANQDGPTSQDGNRTILPPPPAPREISDRYFWRLLTTDGWSIAAFVFTIIGFVFTLVGTGLTIGRITAFVGIPFLIVGPGFLVFALVVISLRIRSAQGVVNVLRTGQSTRGKIVEVQENYSVAINGRHPWTIQYRFSVNNLEYQGIVKTLNTPGREIQVGLDTYVLYLPEDPNKNCIFPHP